MNKKHQSTRSLSRLILLLLCLILSVGILACKPALSVSVDEPAATTEEETPFTPDNDDDDDINLQTKE